MLETIVKIFFISLFSIICLIFMKRMLNSDIKLYSFKNILYILMLVIMYTCLYTVSYNSITIIIQHLFGFLICTLIYKKQFTKILILYIIFFLMLLISDLIACSILYMPFISLEQMRSQWLYMLISNFSVLIVLMIIINIKILNNKIKSFIDNISVNKFYENSVFFVLIFLTVINLFYNILNIYEFNISYLINFIITVAILIVMFFYAHNSLEYTKLLNEYDSLFLYIQEFEDVIDNISLTNHEMKNQLVVLKNYVELNKQKEAINLINDITKTTYQNDDKLLSELKNLPKGGLKGLIYYKVLTAKSKKVSIEIDVSADVYKKLNKMSINQNKILCQIIGIYLDNAIEAASENRKKIIAVEIYSLDKNSVSIVISNTFKNKEVDFNKIGKKGYTTKGKGHGKGTYLAGKLISKNNWLTEEHNVRNKLYIQKVEVNTKKEK